MISIDNKSWEGKVTPPIKTCYAPSQPWFPRQMAAFEHLSNTLVSGTSWEIKISKQRRSQRKNISFHRAGFHRRPRFIWNSIRMFGSGFWPRVEPRHILSSLASFAPSTSTWNSISCLQFEPFNIGCLNSWPGSAINDSRYPIYEATFSLELDELISIDNKSWNKII